MCLRPSHLPSLLLPRHRCVDDRAGGESTGKGGPDNGRGEEGEGEVGADGAFGAALAVGDGLRVCGAARDEIVDPASRFGDAEEKARAGLGTDGAQGLVAVR